MRIVFLGTNGWYDTATGNTVSIFIDSSGYTVILDAGNGLWRPDRYADFNKPAYLFLSHFHLDHVAGLHVINKFVFRKGLADLLIAECALKPGHQAPEWPHLNPESAARIALEGRVKKLVLVHFDAEMYTTIGQRLQAKAVAETIFKPVVSAQDEMVIDV